jgi:LysM repeat protein
MSETSPEPTGGPPKSGGKLGVWAKKYGPLPLWGWAAIGLVIILGVLYLKNKSSATTADAAAQTADTTAGAGQIPQFVNQTYTTVQPPSAPSPPPSTSVTPVGNQIPGHHVITANGTETLSQIASKYHTTPQDIIAFTKAHKVHQSPTETKFFSKPNGKIPKGIVLWVPEPQVTNVTGPGSGEAPTS